jgi:acyl carrier protein
VSAPDPGRPGDEAGSAVCRIVASVLPRAVARRGITPEMDLRADLGLDSVALMSIVFLFDEELGIDAFGRTEAFVKAQRVADLIDVVRGPSGRGGGEAGT